MIAIEADFVVLRFSQDRQKDPPLNLPQCLCRGRRRRGRAKEWGQESGQAW